MPAAMEHPLIDVIAQRRRVWHGNVQAPTGPHDPSDLNKNRVQSCNVFEAVIRDHGVERMVAKRQPRPIRHDKILDAPDRTFVVEPDHPHARIRFTRNTAAAPRP